jgi:hypothetical protein
MRSALWLSTIARELSTGKISTFFLRARSDSGPLFLAALSIFRTLRSLLTSGAGYVKIRPNGAQGLSGAQERLITSPQDSAPPQVVRCQRLQNEFRHKSGSP